MIIKHGIVNRVENGIFRYQGWPSVCSDEQGTLYAVSSSFRMEHVCPFGKTAMYKSFDNGKTWTPPIVINDTFLDDRDAGILYLGDGKLLITWFCHPTEIYLNDYRKDIIENCGELGKAALQRYAEYGPEQNKCGSFIRISEDYGVTWSKTIQLPVSAPHGPALCKNGNILYLGKEMYSDTMPCPEEQGSVCAFVSTDGGYSWKKQGECKIPDGYYRSNFHEPHCLEIENGKILGLIRAEGKNVPQGFTFFKTFSSDYGKTWSKPECTDIPGSPPHLMKHSSGAVVCSYARRKDNYSIRAVISNDGGKTFGDEIVLDDSSDSSDLGYPASVELKDGSILTVYYQHFKSSEASNDSYCSILYTIWRI